MASEFIGYPVLVTLQNSENSQLHGVVANVVNQKLQLQNVTFLWNGHKHASYTIDASTIADLEIAPSYSTGQNQHDLPTTSSPSNPTPSKLLPAKSDFIDPAILSYAKRDGPPKKSKVQETPTFIQALSPVMIADSTIVSPPTNSTPNFITGQSSISSIGTSIPKTIRRRDSSATAILTEPFDAMAIKDGFAEVKIDKKVKKNGRKAKEAQSQTAPGIIDMKDINHGPLTQTTKSAKGKGWRQTPLIEELPKVNGQKKKQRGRKSVLEDASGWATEDATDIQDLGDFDFESNLSKFDKRRIFDDIRKDDPIADTDRLVSFNRKTRLGTNGGKNLHFTENVLDIPNGQTTWKSEAGETEDDVHDETYSSSKGSRRASSRRPLQTRKPSALIDQLDRTLSPRPLIRVTTGSPINGSISGSQASFRLQNNKPCHCVSPLQMLEIEQLCTSEMGITEDILTENAGRSIAEAVLKLPNIRYIIFFVGNHKSGARAVAAARHLRNRRFRVTVVVLGGEREDSLLEVMRRQLSTYKKGQGYVDSWDEFKVKLEAGSPLPDLVVDALFGIHITLDELRIDDQATAFEIITWCGQNATIEILSIDVPSGLSATSGLITETDGQLLIMNAKQVISLGGPKTGLLHAMASKSSESKWQVMVADIGISMAAWQKHGSRRKHGIDFGKEWIVPIKLVTGVGQ